MLSFDVNRRRRLLFPPIGRLRTMIASCEAHLPPSVSLAVPSTKKVHPPPVDSAPCNRSFCGHFWCLEGGAGALVDATWARHSRIVHRPRPEDDPEQRRPDISRAQELLAWKPRTMLKKGLASTIAYFDKLLSDQKLEARIPVCARSDASIAVAPPSIKSL